jgi:hypothetical protein
MRKTLAVSGFAFGARAFAFNLSPGECFGFEFEKIIKAFSIYMKENLHKAKEFRSSRT